MKSFHDAAHIAPILAEIRAFYTPVNDPLVLKALHCVALLQKNRTRDYKAIRTREQGGFYHSSAPMKALYDELAEWTQAAETEPGELDRWMYDEQERIQEATRAALIEEYGRRATA